MRNPMTRGIRAQAWCFIALLIACGVLLWFRQYPILVERYYGQGFYPHVARVWQSAFGWIPFSFGDLYYVGVVLLGLCWIYRAVRLLVKKAVANACCAAWNVLNLSLVLYVAFYVLWGLNYYRVPLSERLLLHEVRPTFADLLEVTEYCIEQTNALREALGEADFDRSNISIFREAEALMLQNKSLGSELFRYKPKVKKPIINAANNYMGVSGYFNPYTHESHINSAMPVVSRPFTACHELAHQAGVGFEDEANLIGFILAAESSDALFRYSAYYTAMWKLLNDIYYRDPGIYQHYYAKINQAVIADAMNDNAYWLKYIGAVNTATTTFYNHYLEANNQPEGMERYNYMVGLLVRWYVRGKGC